MSKANIHLFLAGAQVSNAGESISFTEADLAASANAYDPKIHEAPLVVGHPKLDAPAYGWVDSLVFAEGDGLTAMPHQVNADFAELHSAGSFKKVSGSFYRPDSPNNPVPGVWYLRHVGFLGAQPPAVKGLRDAMLVDYSEADDDCITVDFAEQAPAQKTPTQKTEPPPEDTVSQKELDKLKADNAKLKKDLDAANATATKTAAERVHEKNASFAETLVDDTKIGSDDALPLVAILNHLQAPVEDGDAASFGEGDDAKPLHTLFSNFLGGLEPRAEFAEIATKKRAAEQEHDDDAVQYAETDDKDAIEMDKKIRAHMKKHNITNYAVAAQAVATKAGA